MKDGKRKVSDATLELVAAARRNILGFCPHVEGGGELAAVISNDARIDWQWLEVMIGDRGSSVAMITDCYRLGLPVSPQRSVSMLLSSFDPEMSRNKAVTRLPAGDVTPREGLASRL